MESTKATQFIAAELSGLSGRLTAVEQRLGLSVELRIEQLAARVAHAEEVLALHVAAEIPMEGVADDSELLSALLALKSRGSELEDAVQAARKTK